ncbi:MAG: Asp23/Gls24 family envelope stress response protein, partial [Acidimicrobiales bacterium]
MTSTVASPASRTALADPAERGGLTISGGTVERIAAQAVTEVDGVGGAASRVLGVAVGGEDLGNTAKVTA